MVRARDVMFILALLANISAGNPNTHSVPDITTSTLNDRRILKGGNIRAIVCAIDNTGKPLSEEAKEKCRNEYKIKTCVIDEAG